MGRTSGRAISRRRHPFRLDSLDRTIILPLQYTHGWSAYRTPLNFARLGDDIYVLAAFGRKTHWYRNILAAPEIAMWLPDGRWLATAEDASEDPRRLEIVRQVLIDSGFVAPLMGLHPHVMTDDSLAQATGMYRLLRLRPLHREDSPDGPGSLIWVWAVIAAALTAMLGLGLLRRRARDPEEPS